MSEPFSLDMTSPAGLHARRTARALITACLTDEALFFQVLNEELTGELDPTFLYGTVQALTWNCAALIGIFASNCASLSAVATPDDKENVVARLAGLPPEEVKRLLLAGLSVGDENLEKFARCDQPGPQGTDPPSAP